MESGSGPPLPPFSAAGSSPAPAARVGTPLPDLARVAAAALATLTGRAPAQLVAAPGRVNLIGEHVDYADGLVLPMAIDRHTVVAAVTTSDDTITIATNAELGDAPRRVTIARDDVLAMSAEQGLPTPRAAVPGWARYPLATLALAARAGRAVPPCGFAIASDIPPGAGLSSSAALTVATATLVEALTGRPFEPLEKARLCQAAEHLAVGVPCGLMDPYASVHGRADHALLLDCRSGTARAVRLDPSAVSVLLVESDTAHALAGGEYAQRRVQVERAARALGVPALRDVEPATLDARAHELEPADLPRARHVVEEIARVRAAVEFLARGDWLATGRLLFASHASLRDLFAVSVPALDAIVDAADRLGPDGGAFGARLTGAGFGGCAVVLVRPGAEAAVGAALSEVVRSVTGRPGVVHRVRAADGAGTLPHT